MTYKFEPITETKVIAGKERQVVTQGHCMHCNKEECDCPPRETDGVWKSFTGEFKTADGKTVKVFKGQIYSCE